MKKKILVAVVGVLAVTTFLAVAGCGQKKAGTGVEELKKGVSKEVIDERVKEIEKSMSSVPGQSKRKIPAELKKNIYRQAKESLERERQMLIISEKQGIKVSDNQVDKRFAQIKEMLNKQKKSGFAEVLKRENKTEDQFKEMIQKQMIFEELRKKLAKDIKVSDKEIKDFYDKNKMFFKDAANPKKYRTFDQVKAVIKQMLISQKVSQKMQEMIQGGNRPPIINRQGQTGPIGPQQMGPNGSQQPISRPSPGPNGPQVRIRPTGPSSSKL